MFITSPAESVHTLNWEDLQAQDVTLWTLEADQQVAGFGALRELDPKTGELKSMRVDPTLRGRGLGAKLLDFLESVAMERGYERLYLETGTDEFFAPAQRLYERFGYDACPPFGSYHEDPFSLFMTKALLDRRG